VTGMLSVESFSEALVGTNLGCCGCQSKGNWTWDGIDKYPFVLLCFFSLLAHIASMSKFAIRHHVDQKNCHCSTLFTPSITLGLPL